MDKILQGRIYPSVWKQSHQQNNRLLISTYSGKKGADKTLHKSSLLTDISLLIKMLQITSEDSLTKVRNLHNFILLNQFQLIIKV